MNKSSAALKKTGFLLATGLVLLLMVMAVSALNAKATELVYEKRDYTVSAAGIEEIRIKARNMPVRVTPNSGSEITVHYYTCEQDPYEVTLDGGVLALKYKKDIFTDISNWFSSVFNVFSNSNPKVEVLVPAAYAGQFRLETSNAPVSVSGLQSLGEARINTSNSAIDVSNVSAFMIEAHTFNGAITLENAAVSGVADLKSSNGTLTARQVAAKGSLHMETSNGRIVVDQVAGAVIELKSSNGSVTGTVEGKRSDYTISSDTSNGDDSLGDGGKGQFKLKVNTSNGNIDIRFLGE